MKNKQQLIHQKRGQALFFYGLWPSFLGMVLVVIPTFLIITLFFMLIIGTYMYISIARKKAKEEKKNEERLNAKKSPLTVAR